MGGDEFCALIDAPGHRRTRESRTPPPRSASTARALRSAAPTGRSGCRARRTTARARCGSPTSACTNRSAAAVPPPRASQETSCCARSPNEIPSFGTHLRDVAALASATAEMFSLPPEEVEQIRHAAELHDVGKVAIPDAILEKPTSLDENEWAFIRRHTADRRANPRRGPRPATGRDARPLNP